MDPSNIIKEKYEKLEDVKDMYRDLYIKESDLLKSSKERIDMLEGVIKLLLKDKK